MADEKEMTEREKAEAYVAKKYEWLFRTMGFEGDIVAELKTWEFKKVSLPKNEEEKSE